MTRAEVCDDCPHSLGTTEGGDLRCPHLPAPYPKPCQLAAFVRNPESVCPGPDQEQRKRFAAASVGTIFQGCGGGQQVESPPLEGPMPEVQQWDRDAVAASAEFVLLRLAICDRCEHHTAGGRCAMRGGEPVGAFVGRRGEGCPKGKFT